MARELNNAINQDEDPTKRLKRMLEEQGIEWWHDADLSLDHTEWMTDDAVFTSLGMDGEMLAVKVISKMTPEQAIAATVGERYEMHICKRCGVAYELNIIDEGFGKSRFCPNCGYREMYQ